MVRCVSPVHQPTARNKKGDIGYSAARRPTRRTSIAAVLIAYYNHLAERHNHHYWRLRVVFFFTFLLAEHSCAPFTLFHESHSLPRRNAARMPQVDKSRCLCELWCFITLAWYGIQCQGSENRTWAHAFAKHEQLHNWSNTKYTSTRFVRCYKITRNVHRFKRRTGRSGRRLPPKAATGPFVKHKSTYP